MPHNSTVWLNSTSALSWSVFRVAFRICLRFIRVDSAFCSRILTLTIRIEIWESELPLSFLPKVPKQNQPLFLLYKNSRNTVDGRSTLRLSGWDHRGERVGHTQQHLWTDVDDGDCILPLALTQRNGHCLLLRSNFGEIQGNGLRKWRLAGLLLRD